MSAAIKKRSSDLGRAVSRILSSRFSGRGENHLSQQPVPGTHSALRNLQRAAAWSPIWPCTRWGFPCLLACAWSGGLLLHLFTLTSLPKERGGLFSVALSVGKSHDIAARMYPNLPKRRVTRHRALWCSDFPPLSTLSRNRSDSPPFQNRRKYIHPTERSKRAWSVKL
jgi:hypothetical protein